MKYIGIIILLVLCLTLLLFTGCRINTTEVEAESGNLEDQEEINQSSNISQSSSIDPVEEPVIEEDTEATGTVYPQKWATGDGTAENPWAGDCLNNALTAVPNGGTIFLKAGCYLLASTLYSSTKSYNLIGEGMDKSIIVLDIENATGIYITTDYCTLKGFTVDGDSQIDKTLYPAIGISNCDHITLENIEAKNSGQDGLDISACNYSLFQNLYAHDNYEDGIHPGAAAKEGRNQYNTYNNIYAWNNPGGGFGDWSTAEFFSRNNTYNNINCWDNGYGITLSGIIGATLSNSSASGNTRYGIYLSRIEDCSIDNCSTTLNGIGGMFFNGSVKNTDFTNVIVKNNASGINLLACENIKFTTCQSYDDRDTPLQTWGLMLTGTNTGISLLNCKLSPNKNGEIYNPAGVVLTVITEKREFLLLSL